jgi:cell fate regulator YaaT (PSP1 superfamily)
VDFRELVRDLASVFRVRIELRQIGVRDEAKMLGGLGPCGRPLCCSTFLGDFEPVSIKMAKEQNLSLNPTKISGICGRLMCCLKFECDQYRTEEQKESAVGVTVTHQGRQGVIVAENPEEETVVVEFSDEERLEIPISEITEVEDYPE